MDAHGASSRAARVCLVSGEAGIGKTRLLREFASRLDDRVRVLTGECLELGAEGLPYAPFLAVIRQLIREHGVAAITRTLPGDGPYALASWLPAIGEPLSGVDAELGRIRLFGEVLALLEGLATQRPLVLVLEDLHWADPSSRALLGFLAGSLTAPDVLIVGSFRSTDVEGAHPLCELVIRLTRDPAVTSISLRRLSVHEVGRQLAAIHNREPDPHRITQVYQRSDGNPLFVEALSTAEPGDPVPLRSLLLSGVDDLSEAAGLVLRHAAVAGNQVGHRLLSAVLPLADTEAESAIRALADRHLLVITEDGYRFRHALIRDAVYERLLPGERIRLHRGFAETLRDHPDAVPAERLPAELAAHWHAAENVEEALAHAWRAARVAATAYAYDEQQRMLELVLDLWPRAKDPAARLGVDRDAVVELAATACVHSGDFTRGDELVSALLEPAVDDPDGAGDPERVAALLELRGVLRNRHNTSGLPDIEAALALLPSDEPTRLRGRLLAALAHTRISVRDLAEVREPATEAVRIARLHDDPGTLAKALAALGVAEGLETGVDAAEPVFAEATELTQRLGDHPTLMSISQWHGNVLVNGGQFRKAATAIRRGIAAAERLGLIHSRGPALSISLGFALEQLGDWPEAAKVYRDGLSWTAAPLYRIGLLRGLGGIAIATGELDEAQLLATEIDALVDAANTAPTWRVEQATYRFRLAMAREEHDEAETIMRRLLDDFAVVSNSTSGWYVLSLAADLRSRRSSADAGWRRELLALAEPLTIPGRFEAAHRAGFLAAVDHEDPSGWRSAATLWRELEAPHQLGWCLVGLAEALRASGQAAEAIRARGQAADSPPRASGQAADALLRTSGQATDALLRTSGQASDAPLRTSGQAADALLRGRGQAADVPLRARGQASDAPLREAATIAAKLGARPLAERVARLAAQVGIAVGEAPQANPGPGRGLTAREVDVLRLLAKGLSNRQIAGELFISVSTAGVHVSRILAKLEVASRGEAAALAHREQWFG
ncbi:transcriptional regulator, LuxR family [Stackebrandtia nassauensis DSM 44728]|uniref:Transcriptional regulator, LuxR family n=2 Tax=Stackebrandtia TaxID=283810 RepID=D3Q887_STANL|nr:transcriptional regulator, LuxR family [Stackebrandtia nassauensis DSM 44728]